MDCEKFDEHVIDALYEELDELTAAALKRHTDGCARCSAILSGLRSARDGAVLPLEEPSADLEARILEAERTAQKHAPWPRKLMRAAAWAGSHAMRPQLAMAALFMLVVGSSLLLLRARPGTVGAPVQITERGEPAPAATAMPESISGARRLGGKDQGAATEQKGEGSVDAKPQAPADLEKNERSSDATLAIPPAAPAAAEAMAAPTAASTAAPGGKMAEEPGTGSTPQQALSWAREGRASGGCSIAVGRYDTVAKQFPSTPEAETASREASECQREVALAPPAPKPAAKVELAKPAPAKPAASAGGPPKP
jgi:hypothetical protein